VGVIEQLWWAPAICPGQTKTLSNNMNPWKTKQIGKRNVYSHPCGQKPCIICLRQEKQFGCKDDGCLKGNRRPAAPPLSLSKRAELLLLLVLTD